MPAYAALNGKKNQLIRKALGGSLYLTDISGPLITSITDPTTSALVALPTTGGTYIDCGHFTDEGLRFARAVEQDEVTSFGYSTPTRTDITTDTETLQVDFQETNKTTIAVGTGALASGLTLTTGSKELKIVKPTTASPRRYRALALSVDGPPEAEIYIARFYPRLVVTDYTDQAYAKGSEVRWGVTFRAEVDSATGSALTYFFGGPGWASLTADMGLS